MNAAGGSSSGTDPGAGGGNTFNPGGRPGGPGGGGFNPGGGSSATTGNYNIYIYGGDLYVNCDGDGLDSNGGLYLYGGTQAVFSMRSGGDNSAIDADGTVSIQGASVFTAGTTGMDGSALSGWFGSNQKYYASKTSYSAGKIINTKAGSSGSVVFSYALPKAVNYIMASYPSTVSANTPSFATQALPLARAVRGATLGIAAPFPTASLPTPVPNAAQPKNRRFLRRFLLQPATIRWIRKPLRTKATRSPLQATAA